jgi:hypothetical protein
MQLDDAGFELSGERWHLGTLVARHGHYHVLGIEGQLAGRYPIPVSFLRQSLHGHASPNREREAGRV